MKAVFYNDWGDESVLRVGELPKPSNIGPGKLLVRVVAAALNPVDWKIRSGVQRALVAFSFPITVGFDFSGIVEEVGPVNSADGDDGWASLCSGETFAPGDAVFGLVRGLRMGTLAEYVVVDSCVCAKKPSRLSFRDASALPLVCVTAAMLLRKCPLLKERSANEAAASPGPAETTRRRILITGGSGGVGAHAIQLSRSMFGCTEVWATAGSGIDLCQQLGADRVLDYRDGDWVAKLIDEKETFDVVFDCAGDFKRLVPLLSNSGGASLVSINEAKSLESVREWVVNANPDNIRFGVRGLIESSFLGPAINWGMGASGLEQACAARNGNFATVIGSGHGELTAKIAQFADASLLKPVIDSDYPLADALTAFKRLESGHSKGKCVIIIDSGRANSH